MKILLLPHLILLINANIMSFPLYTKEQTNNTFTTIEEAIEALWNKRYYVKLDIGVPSRSYLLALDTLSDVSFKVKNSG